MVLDSTDLDESYVSQLSACVEKGLAFQGNTIEEAATAAGVDAAALQATVDRWNEQVSNGKDEDFGNENLRPLSQSPYYVIPDSQGITGSFGGVHTDMESQVLSTEGEPIPGLYAAGECANGDFYYRDYICGGSSLAMGMAFGRKAGENAAIRAAE